MTGFASMELIQHANSKNFAPAIMKIQMLYGFCHTIALSTGIAISTTFAVKLWTYCTSTAIIFWATTITP
jgi:hypothetical protein